MRPSDLKTESQITFLYYPDMAEPARFYEEVMGFELVDAQGIARIYRVSGTAFLGLVAGDKGFRRPQPLNAVLLTVLVNDLEGWYSYLQARGAKLLTGLEDRSAFGLRCFFVEDPGGYALEIQTFVRPHLREIFQP